MVKDYSNSNKSSHTKQVPKSSSHLFLNIILVALVFLILFLSYALIVQISNSFNKDASPEQKLILPSQVQIEVLNGCGISGAADKFTEFLREKGFDVVNKGNYSSFDVDYTLVIDRSNNYDKSLMVADAISVERKRIVKQFNNQYFLDVTLIIGKDYNTLLTNN